MKDDLPNDRCPWVDLTKADYVTYHDEEWGVPVHDDRTMFEFLILEGAQAGLSWYTVLRKRRAYKRAFANFEAEKVARFGKRQLDRLMQNAAIIRNQQKIAAAVINAKCFLAVQEEFGSFRFLYLAFCRRQAACAQAASIERLSGDNSRV